MQSQTLSKAIETCADPQRAGAWLARLRESGAAAVLKRPSAEQARILAWLLAGSQQAGEWLEAHPAWLPPLLEPGALEHPRRDQGFRREIEAWLKPALEREEIEGALAKLRDFKQREMLRIAARDLARLGGTEEIMREISDVADACLEAVLRLCLQPLARRLGQPFHAASDGRWQATGFCVLGLGKLGGQELNYSSDVDVIFLYSEEGHVFKTRPRPREQTGKSMASHQFFKRLAESMIAEVTRLTPQGALYRMDLRLRPEGADGPLVRSLGSFETYYAQWGQTWERMMLIKARPVAGDAQLGAEFLEMIQPFRYPRSLGEGLFRDVKETKCRLESQVVKAGELERNVKLGRGGIREVEFIVQTLQLLHGGRVPFLQGAATMPALEKLAAYHFLPADEAKELAGAYLFLRDVEHRLQMEAGQQTHTIPTARQGRERLARLMGFASLPAFESARQAHCRQIRRLYEKIVSGGEPAPASALPGDFGEEAPWKEWLARHHFREVARALRMVEMFVNGPGYVHVSARTAELARDLLPKFFALCPPQPGPGGGAARTRLSDPDRVLVRLQSFIEAYGARATLYEQWSRKPALFELLLLLFDRSEFLAERAIRNPDLVDELEAGGRLRRQKSAGEILRDLRFGLGDKDQSGWLRRYHQAELMRIGLRDILGLVDFEQNLGELSALAEACLQYALEVVCREHCLDAAPLCILGLGKLGGAELDYGSDLDLLFVAPAGAKDLASCQRLVAEVKDLLARPTELGIVFHIDTRLRPDGEKGLLVHPLDACEEYYRRRAALWEIQALTRARPIAGDMALGGRFQQLAGALANFTPENAAAGFVLASSSAAAAPPPGLAAYSPDWKAQIARMRERTLQERTPPGREALAIKTGAGGLMDAEFLAQTFCLTGGWLEPNTGKALRRAVEEGLLAPAAGQSLLRSYARLRRVEGILRLWSCEGESELPDEEEALQRVATRCGFESAARYMKELKEIRADIRAAFQAVFAA
ncbi:MAG: bifunctional [glutamate--ammonia ligase]-adenylyl-L-tyrosine phosphorylase/[glutamate--ammonia-ligase] adenylyltransferase [Verrucomicrobiota bacterium]|jgi:glutamate-ammonia-ligase adenylyltransferase